MTGAAVGPEGITVLPVGGIGEVAPGDDLARLLSTATVLRDGDILVVTSKVVSKAEGLVRVGGREEALAGETDRTLAVRGSTSIVRTRHGLVLAAAGIDASNTEPGTVVLLPRDPDESARRLRETLHHRIARNVAVLVTDTAGRAWRNGQSDIAVGVAGIHVLHDYAGRRDSYGNQLAVTEPAVADELAAAADLVKGKLDQRPAAVVRGLTALVLRPGDHGPGAVALVRDEAHDMFGLGAREAVLGALHGREARGFDAPCSAAELVAELSAIAGDGAVVRLEGPDPEPAVTARLVGTEHRQGVAEAMLRTASFALGWHAEPAAEPAGSPSGSPGGEPVLRFRLGRLS